MSHATTGFHNRLAVIFDAMRGERRVQNLARADYSEGSELMGSLELAVKSICDLIHLRRLGHGE